MCGAPGQASDAHLSSYSAKTGDGIRTAAEADAYVGGLNFSGMTPLGTAIEQRVIEPFVVRPAQQLALSKPVLVRPVGLGEPWPSSCNARPAFEPTHGRAAVRAISSVHASSDPWPSPNEIAALDTSLKLMSTRGILQAGHLYGWLPAIDSFCWPRALVGS